MSSPTAKSPTPALRGVFDKLDGQGAPPQSAAAPLGGAGPRERAGAEMAGVLAAQDAAPPRSTCGYASTRASQRCGRASGRGTAK